NGGPSAVRTPRADVPTNSFFGVTDCVCKICKRSRCFSTLILNQSVWFCWRSNRGTRSNLDSARYGRFPGFPFSTRGKPGNRPERVLLRRHVFPEELQ